jgi:hypothetical protein
MGLTPAVLATSLSVMRPLERRRDSGLFKGLTRMGMGWDLVRIALSIGLDKANA